MEVFTRFENESGGKLMKATLCLLEVSRHGLLEFELLALLGTESNIVVPEYIEVSKGFICCYLLKVILSFLSISR